ncbi:MAG: hypothetical protein AAFQ52_04540 [Chloroflexota bacterium]
MMMRTRNDAPNRFLRHWLFHALVIWPIAAIASVITWLPVAVVASMMGGYDNLTPIVNGISTIGLLTLPGMTVGYMVGDVQWRLMGDHLNWRQKGWVRMSIIGGLLGEWLMVAGTLLLANSLPERTQLMIMLPLFIVPLSIAQWWILRRTTRDAWLWILANVSGAMVFSGVFFMNPMFPFVSIEPLSSLLLWLLAASSLGIITGIVLLWLYDRPLLDWDENSELARVHVEVYSRNDNRRR